MPWTLQKMSALVPGSDFVFLKPANKTVPLALNTASFIAAILHKQMCSL